GVPRNPRRLLAVSPMWPEINNFFLGSRIFFLFVWRPAVSWSGYANCNDWVKLLQNVPSSVLGTSLRRRGRLRKVGPPRAAGTERRPAPGAGPAGIPGPSPVSG